MKTFFVLFTSTILFVLSCQNKTENKSTYTKKHWEMSEVFDDEAQEWLQGGYCAYHFHEHQVISDSASSENSGEMVAILIQPEIKLNSTKAVIYVNEDKLILTLTKDQSKKGFSLNRTFQNKDFEVNIQMKIVEIIDGMDDGDMEIYSGKMTVHNIHTNERKTYSIKGGC